MYALFKKEMAEGLNSLAGTVSILIFLVTCSLILWVYPDSNILDNGYATLQSFFDTAPWVFMFLIPAVTMRSFAEERQSGTLELLLTRPVRDWTIVLTKFAAAWLHIFAALVPTGIYVYSISRLGNPAGNLDWGGVAGSYLGLLLLAGVFVAIGLTASSLTRNQVVAFLVAVLLCFIFYSGFDSLSRLMTSSAQAVAGLGVAAHYQSISRGVLDTRDLLYFLSAGFLFLYLTRVSLGSRQW